MTTQQKDKLDAIKTNFDKICEYCKTENETKNEKKSKNENENKISEIDTQVILVEEVLKVAGYDTLDINQVRRADRSATGKHFDIEVYGDNGTLLLAIEVKSLGSNEFNIDRVKEDYSSQNSGSRKTKTLRTLFITNKIKKELSKKKILITIKNLNRELKILEEKESISSIQVSNGKLGEVVEIEMNGNTYYFHYTDDAGVGQLRHYLNKYGHVNGNNRPQKTIHCKCIGKDVPIPLPILTNGKRWVLFGKEFFNITKPFSEDCILAEGDICCSNFEEIINIIQKINYQSLKYLSSYTYGDVVL